MDRNNYVPFELPFDRVALRKESVDRNTEKSNCCGAVRLSLSARRAWIEIKALQGFFMSEEVALRKESVDRNMAYPRLFVWIAKVALRKESVDRNIPRCQLPAPEPRRSPQGERG